MIKKAIAKVVEREDLSEGEMIEVMEQIMSGGATQAQIGAFITALRMKGETVDEITGAARVMRERATPIRVGRGVAGYRPRRYQYRSGDDSRCCRHGGRWHQQLQCFDHGLFRRIRLRGEGRQARQPLGIFSLRQRRCSRKARRES